MALHVLQNFLRKIGSKGAVLSCDGNEGALTWCFFVLFVLTQKITTACGVSLDS